MGQEIVKWDEEYAKAAAQYAAEEKSEGGVFISTKGGVLSFGEEEMPGNQMCVVILDSVRENTFYGTDFDADNLTPPVCYAFGRGTEEMAPHESMQAHTHFEPQNESCDGCPHAEWGSSDKGRGKACQNRRRLALIPAGYYVKNKGSRDFDLELFEEQKHFKTADIAFLKLPVTSVKEWSKYVTQLSASVRRPPFGVVTRVYLEPDAKSQYKVRFEMLEELPDEMAPIIMARHDEAMKSIITAYAPPREDEKPKKGGLRGLKGRK